MDKLILIQWNVFVISVITGMIITFMYDNIRCVRKVVYHNEIALALEDIIFWIGSAMYLVYIMYEYNDGDFRGYIFFGAIIGMVIYLYTISCIYIKIVSYILCKLKWCFVTFVQKLKLLLKNIIKKVKIKKETSKEKFSMIEGNISEYDKNSKTKKK